MLVYFFWHWPDADTDHARYGEALVSFHRSLREGAIAGFRTSGTTKVPRLPWDAASAPAYEDWYALDDAAAIDALDEGAVAARRRSCHDDVARLAGGGHGGLYQLRSGPIDVLAGATAQWFSKPRGMRYGELFTALAPLLSPGTALLQRKMVLGPAPEFCLRSSSELPLPAPLSGVALAMTAISVA